MSPYRVPLVRPLQHWVENLSHQAARKCRQIDCPARKALSWHIPPPLRKIGCIVVVISGPRSSIGGFVRYANTPRRITAAAFVKTSE